MQSFFARSTPKPAQAQQPTPPPASTPASTVSGRSRTETVASNAVVPNVSPFANVLVEGYKQEYTSPSKLQPGDGASTSRERTLIGGLDSVNLQLAWSTAMDDSERYEVLLPEEVDEIKKKLEDVKNTIDRFKRRLAAESTIHGATRSLNRLDNKDGSEEEKERAVLCEGLSQSLWNMEHEREVLQTRLLKHTAGALQAMHKNNSDSGSIAGLTTRSTLPDDEWPDHDTGAHYLPYHQDSFDEDGLLYLGFGEEAHRPKGDPGESFDSVKQRADTQQVELQRQRSTMEHCERQVQDMMVMVREIVRKSGPTGDSLQDRNTEHSHDDVVKSLPEDVGFLETLLETLVRTQGTRDEDNRQAVVRAQTSNRQIQQATTQLQGVNGQIYHAILAGSKDGASAELGPPPRREDELHEHITYVENGTGHLGRLLSDVSSMGSKGTNQAEQYETQLQALWDTIMVDQSSSPRLGNDSFSMLTFDARVREIHSRVNALQNQKEVLTRQIQQQRELNASSDEVKDVKIADMSEEMRSLRIQLEKTEEEAKLHLEKHTATLAELGESQGLVGEVARLQTELTFAQAELDGAKGTRAERKAEAAADPTLVSRVKAREDRIQVLEKELGDTISDYEAMTKATIDYEKEREHNEAMVDQLRTKIEQLETQLSEEKIQNLTPGSLRSPATPMGVTSAGVLKNEFKKMMRDTKADHSRVLKVRPSFLILRHTVFDVIPLLTNL